MGLNPLSRRSVLSVTGVGAAGFLAGCTILGSDDSASIPSGSGQDRTDDQSGDSGLYQRSIDSVPLVRALGVETQMTDREGGGQGQGSGFVLDDSYVVTNEHVVSGAEEVDVQYTTGEWSSTSVVGTDERSVRRSRPSAIRSGSEGRYRRASSAGSTERSSAR